MFYWLVNGLKKKSLSLSLPELCLSGTAEEMLLSKKGADAFAVD